MPETTVLRGLPAAVARYRQATLERTDLKTNRLQYVRMNSEAGVEADRYLDRQAEIEGLAEEVLTARQQVRTHPRWKYRLGWAFEYTPCCFMLITITSDLQ